MILPTLEQIRAEQARRALMWRPFPGPQTMAYDSPADILFYGGAAGGGKTDLLLGVAYQRHHRAVIFRRVFPNLRAIIDRSRAMYNPDGASAGRDSYNESLHRWRFGDGRQIEFGSIQYEKDKTDWQGQPHDLYGFDEITEFTESQFRFVTGWNRTTRRGQRCRIICTGNPPTSAEGDWVISYWGPWLDPDHPKPAAPGELRWYTTVAGKDVEMPNGDPVLLDGEWVKPLSRTFIPAKVQDNPALVNSGYVANLQALPEPLRSKMLYGDFRAGRQDDTWQVIPSAWVKAAQDRWKAGARPEVPMTALGVDVARGGSDSTVLAPRWLNWFGELHVYPGEATPDGPKVAGLVLLHREADAQVLVDVVGVGTSVYDHLKDLEGMRVTPINGAAGSGARDKSGQLGFVNLRAEIYWKFREALDPASGQEIALPPDPQLRADLCAPKWTLTARGIQIEPKDCGKAHASGGNCCIKHRIGRSPDRGDAVVYASAIPHQGATGLLDWLKGEAETLKKDQELAKEGA